MPQIISYQVADSIDIKKVKEHYKAQLLHVNSDELFYQTGTDRYLYIFKYGGIAFYNYEEADISSTFADVMPFARNQFSKNLSDEFLVETDATESKISYNKIAIKSTDREMLRMIMLNVSQSVALDYYSDQTTILMEETNYHTQKLEKRGRLAISGSNLKKYIGKTLLLKNRIAENLYIFDSPAETWENEELDKLHTELKRNFELQERFRHVSEGLGIVKENLELFKDLLQYRNSIFLEWIVIALIAIEVLNFLLEKFHLL